MRLVRFALAAALLAVALPARAQNVNADLRAKVDDVSMVFCVEGMPCVLRATAAHALAVTLFDLAGNYVAAGGGGAVTPGHYEITQFRCDNSGSITGTSGAVGGITCTSGSWFAAVDARGALVASLSVYEYGAGSGSWSLWNCVAPAGSSGDETIPGVDLPGVEDPNSAPSSADPDPLCTKINLDAAGAEIPITGNLTREVHLNSRTFDYLVVRTDTCTGNCDASLEVQVRW